MLALSPAIRFSLWSLVRVVENKRRFVFKRIRFEFIRDFAVGIFDEGFLQRAVSSLKCSTLGRT